MASSPPTQGQELYDDARPDQNPHLGPKRPALSQEEIAILRECNRESFWYRCVPFSVAFVGGATYLTHAGILKANPRYGLLFKNMGACLLGYIAGKLSYQGVCKQKLLERAPNSTLARTIRGEKVAAPESNIQFYPPDPEGGKAKFRNTDVGEARPSYKELDDTQRPSVDREIRFTDIKTEDQGPDPSSMSYDDLRKKHRAEYEARMATSPKHPLRQPPFPPPKGGRTRRQNQSLNHPDHRHLAHQHGGTSMEMSLSDGTALFQARQNALLCIDNLTTSRNLPRSGAVCSSKAETNNQAK